MSSLVSCGSAPRVLGSSCMLALATWNRLRAPQAFDGVWQMVEAGTLELEGDQGREIA